MTTLPPITIISGGQTGADRAALDFALEQGLPHGGWCPRGRLAEDGPIEPRYRLHETPSRKYAQRTQWNVRDSDATVVLTISPELTGGTALAAACARRFSKPLLHLARDAAPLFDAADEETERSTIGEAATRLREFIDAHGVARLNVAGPRASQEPAIGQFVASVLRSTFER